MKQLAIVVMLAAVASCSSSPASQAVRLDSVAFDVPAEWKRSDSTGEKLRAAVWTPESNARKESVTVISTRRAQHTKLDERYSLSQLLASSQPGLRTVRKSSVTDVVTAQGLAGVRIDTDVIAGAQDQRYRRIHVVLVDGDALVHVIYTAANPDRELIALNLVLRTVRHEEV